jgi:uncharacterized protein (DUF1499 family)
MELRWLIPVVVVIFTLMGAFFVRLIFFGFASRDMDPQKLGINGSNLSPCGDKPNCVCSIQNIKSQSKSEQDKNDQQHLIVPILGGSQTLGLIKNLLIKNRSFRLVQESPNYLYYQYTSDLFGFVDDVEFLFDGSNKIDVRSASRVGYSDLGANRKRVEWIRKQLASGSN